MNKKTFTLASFFTAFGILFLGSFYAWIISQFNEAKFFEKMSYYFNKNFPSYIIEVSEIKFKVSNKLRYEMSNFSIKDRKTKTSLLLAPKLVLDIPVGAFLGNRELRVKTIGLKIDFKKQEDLKNIFFSSKSHEKTIELDLPQLIDRNKFSFRAQDLSLNIIETGNTHVFQRVFFKNLNMSHYTAFEFDGGFGEGSYRLYGEVDLGNFLETRNIKIEAYLKLLGFSDEKQYLNDVAFKVVNKASPSTYAFKLSGISDTAKGEINLLADSETLKISFENFVTSEKLIRDQLQVDRYFNCLKSKNTNLDGVLTYEYRKDSWDSNYTALGDCIQLEHKKEKSKQAKYSWDVKFIDEEGFLLSFQTNDFLFEPENLLNIKFEKEYLVYNNRLSLYNFENLLADLYGAIDLKPGLSFPIELSVKKIDLDKDNYTFRARGLASSDGLTFENIMVKDGKNLKAKGSYLYHHPEKVSEYNIELRKSSAKLLKTFIDFEDLYLTGEVTRGRVSQFKEGEAFKKVFDIKLRKGEFEWSNLMSLMNETIVDSKEKSSSQFLWDKGFKKLNLLGTVVDKQINIDWVFEPTEKKRYKRQGQLNLTTNSTNYSLSTMFERPSSKLKKYLLNKFGSDEVTLKLEKSNEFKIIQ